MFTEPIQAVVICSPEPRPYTRWEGLLRRVGLSRFVEARRHKCIERKRAQILRSMAAL